MGTQIAGAQNLFPPGPLFETYDTWTDRTTILEVAWKTYKEQQLWNYAEINTRYFKEDRR